MLKDFFIVDNVFVDPHEVVRKSKELQYSWSDDCEKYKKDYDVKFYDEQLKKIESNWIGFRTNKIHEEDSSFFTRISNEIFRKSLASIRNIKIDYELKAHFSIIPNNIPFDEKYIHRDASFYAGVVYLNENPQEENGGTVLKINNQNVVIPNKFNRLVMYNSQIPHSQHNSFMGDNIDPRLTLAIFVPKLCLMSNILLS
jgi:hypothetical protein